MASISVQRALESYSHSVFRRSPTETTTSANTPTPNIGGSSSRLQEAISHHCRLPHRTMHLPDTLTLKYIKYVDNMATVLTQYFEPFSSEPANKRGLTCIIPRSSAFSPARINRDSGTRTNPPQHDVASVAQLRDSPVFNGSMVAAISSALLTQATTFKEEGLLKWTSSIRSNRVDSADSAFIRIDPTVESTPPCPPMKPILSAIAKYELCNIVLHHFEAMSTPLPDESELLLEALVRRSKEGGPVQWMACNMDGDDSALRCGCEHCTMNGPDSPGSVSGRMCGVDGDPLLDLLAMCNIPAPSVPSDTQDELGAGSDQLSDFYRRLWYQAVSSDTTFIKLTGGNKLLFCFRARLTQTLYVSPVFRLGTPQLFKMECIVTIAAFEEACSRAMKTKYLEESGELPSEARQNYVPDVNSTDLSLDDFEALWGISMGCPLPPILQHRAFQWTFKAFASLLNETEVLEIYFEPGDFFHLQLRPSSSVHSPIRLRADPPTRAGLVEGSILKVKVHSQYWGTEVFLCYLVQSSGVLLGHEDLIPTGLPFVMKFSRNSQAMAFDRDLIHKLSTSGHEGIVPRCFGGLYSHAGVGVSAFAMEHFVGAYPLQVAESIQLKSRLDAWLEYLHTESRIAHGRLTDTHILFDPHTAGRFHVVGWHNAHNLTVVDKETAKIDTTTTNSSADTPGRDIIGASSWIQADKTALRNIVTRRSIV